MDTTKAFSYKRLSSDAKTFKVDDTVRGPSNVYLSINDAIKWLQYQMKPSPEHKVIFKKMTNWGKLNNGENIDYRYGISVEHEYGKKSHWTSWWNNGISFYHFFTTQILKRLSPL